MKVYILVGTFVDESICGIDSRQDCVLDVFLNHTDAIIEEKNLIENCIRDENYVLDSETPLDIERLSEEFTTTRIFQDEDGNWDKYNEYEILEFDVK